MKKISIGLLALVGAFVAGSSVQGQEADSIVLGGILLRLGMSQNEALAALGPVYDLKDIDYGNWMVSHRGSSTVGDVGNIVFRDRTLTFVNKNWSPPSPTAAQLVEALYDALDDALESVGGGDWQTCRVNSRGLYGVNPDYADLRNIRIICGGHEITVSGGSGIASQVSESISSN